MPVHTNSIGALSISGAQVEEQTAYFCDLNGSIMVPTTEIEVIQHANVPYSLFRRHAIHGQPFTLVSYNYLLNWTAAITALVFYESLKRADYGVRITQHSVVATVAAQVLEVVEAQPPRAVDKVVGSLVANAQVLQVCKWTLMWP